MTITFNQLERAGRLGNQMFQVASSYGIARTRNEPLRLPERWSYRKWFSVPDECFGRRPAGGTEAFNTPEAAHLGKAALYLQDPALFRDVADDVRLFFYPSPEAQSYLGWHSRWDGGIAVHVRRGDLLTQTPGFQPALTVDAPDYYRTALDALDPMGVLPVVVFSDDPQWCAENQLEVFGRKVEVRQTKPRSHIPREYRSQPAMDWVDLLLMSSFPNIIISNSTYAVWAAYLGSKNQRVLHPALWFGANLSHVNWRLMIPMPGDPFWHGGWREVPCA